MKFVRLTGLGLGLGLDRLATATLATAVLALAPAASCGGGDSAVVDERCKAANAVRLAPSADDTATIQQALIEVQAGGTVCLDDGEYSITEGLSLTVQNVSVIGTSPGRGAVLDFADQAGGAETFLVTSDGFLIENLTIKNARGDGVVVRGAENVTFRNLHVYWDAGSVTTNGAYAIFPVNCDKVLIEDNEVSGTSDAGIYVGQSRDVIIRNNKVYGNVAGIEFENTQRGEAYGNDVYDNTGGILVFNLPDLPVKDGRQIRIYDNDIHENNRTNFAVGGTVVASVPTGTGMIIMSADEVQVHDNTFTGNVSTAIAIAGYDTLPFDPPMDPMFDHYPETLYIHDNTYSMNGSDPKDILTLPGVEPLEDILWDGRVDEMKTPPENFKICIKETGATFRNIDDEGGFMNMTTDLAPHDCTYPELAPLPMSW